MATPTTPGTALADPPAPARGLVTGRALFFGLILSVVVCGIVAWAEYVTGTIMIGFLQIPPVAVALLFVVVLGNRLAAWISPRARLQPAELVVIYLMMVLSSMIASRGLIEDLHPTMAGLNYLATPANHWQSLYWGHLKSALVPWNPDHDTVAPAVKWYYEGLPAGMSIPWGVWILPSLLWLILVGLVYTVFLGMAAVIYKLWADEEHLSFPLTRLPLEMVTGETGARDFLRNRLMWLGFAVAVLYFGMNGLHEIWPQIPSIRVRYRPELTQLPWTAMGYTEMWFSLAGVGFFYLLPSEVLFSLWFFFLFARSQEVLAGLLVGAPARGGHASAARFVGDQTAGVSFALVGLMVWTGWVRVRDLWRRQTQGDPAASNTLVSFRAAAFLVSLGLIGILVWWRWAGGSVTVALVEFGIYLFIQAVIMSRATSEAGTLMTEGSFTPFGIWGFFGRRSQVGRHNLVLLAFSHSLFTRDLRGLPLTGMLDAQRLADGVRMDRRRLVPLLVATLAFAIVVASLFHLGLTYQRGGASMYRYIYMGNNQQFWHEFAPLAEGIEEYVPARLIWFGVGIATCLFLGMMRRLYVWWPLLPLGAALSVTWIMCVFWFPALVAWLIKNAVTRYGGLQIYTRLRPFFLGLIFGEFFMAVFWTVISAVFDTGAPMFPWP